ncbi:hypothetical protein K523DRAFT_57563 [Schizophyllum commune Tattone D]|nr:hypothetical protein K523DRAFT_57563 [Schizophyllum commune Tattone D]
MSIIWPFPPRYGNKEVRLRRMYEQSARPGRCTALREALGIDAVYWQELIQAARTRDSIEEMDDQDNLQYIPDMVRNSHPKSCLAQCDTQDGRSTNASPTLVATPSSSDIVPLGQNDDDASYTLEDALLSTASAFGFPIVAKAPLKNEDEPPLNDSFRHFQDPVRYAVWQTSQLGNVDREDAYLSLPGSNTSRNANLQYQTQGQDCSGAKRRRASSFDGFAL